jgi:PKHD-type hydroxylase
MLISIGNILDYDALKTLRASLDALSFVDGRATAGWSAAEVKRNRQAAPSVALHNLQDKVEKAIRANAVFQIAARPKQFTPILFARYSGGETYGSHVDDAIMGGLRTDLAWTLFLHEPEDYDGGELVIEGAAGEQSIKLPAGAMVLYPATTLHRVAPVTRGERLVAVGWVRSLIRSAEQRELLFDLDTTRRALFAREGKSAEFDLLSKSLSNLLRMWAED